MVLLSAGITLVISCWSDQPRAKEKAGEVEGAAVFRAAPHAPRGALGGFLSTGKVFQHRVMFGGFVRPGMATALGHQHVTLPSSWPRAVGFGSQLWGWDWQCWLVPDQPSQRHSDSSPSLGLLLWQRGCFSCYSQCSGNCPKLIWDKSAFNSLGLSRHALGTLGRCWWV